MSDSPSLRLIEVEANTVGEAIMKTTGHVAGEKELAWVRSNLQQAREILQGNCVFMFPGTLIIDSKTNTIYLQCVAWDENGNFLGMQKNPIAERFGNPWQDNYRIVMVDGV